MSHRRRCHFALTVAVALLAHPDDAAAQAPTRLERVERQMVWQAERIQQLEFELSRRRQPARAQLASGAQPPDGAQPRDGASTPSTGVQDQGKNLQRLPATGQDDDVGTDDVLADEELAGRESLSGDARLTRLERTVLGLQTREESFLDSPSTTSRRSTSGRIHLDHWAFPKDSPGVNTMESGDPTIDPQDRFVNRRIRIGISGDVLPMNVSYRAEFEFSGETGARPRDAWIGVDDLVWFQTVRLGNQKRPYGLDHLNSSNFTIFMERPYIVDAINEDNRRLGVCSYGMTDDMAYNWRYGVFDMVQIQNTNSVVDDDYQVEIAGRLAHTWWYDEASGGRGYGHFALAGTTAFPKANAMENQAMFRTHPEARTGQQWLDTGAISGAEFYQMLATEAVINLGPVQLGGEYMSVWLNRAPGRDVWLHGGYVYLSYFLTGEHLPWNRELGILGRLVPFENFFATNTTDGRVGSGSGAWQVAIRLSRADLNDQDILGGVGKSATLALNWHWNSHSRMQFNYIFGRIDDRLASLSAGGSAVVSGDYQISGVRFSIDY